MTEAFAKFDEATDTVEGVVKKGKGGLTNVLCFTVFSMYKEWTGTGEESRPESDLVKSVMVADGVVRDVVDLLKQVDLYRSVILGAIAPLLCKPNFYKAVVNIVGEGFFFQIRKFLDSYFFGYDEYFFRISSDTTILRLLFLRIRLPFLPYFF